MIGCDFNLARDYMQKFHELIRILKNYVTFIFT